MTIGKASRSLIGSLTGFDSGELGWPGTWSGQFLEEWAGRSLALSIPLGTPLGKAMLIGSVK